ncbi:MAG: terminase TerL endonuclease subunit [Candidatus Caldatribacteriota bacterium]
MPNKEKIGKQKGDRVVNFIKSLKHSKGKWYGKPFNLMPWQEKIIRDIFGTIKEDGTRQYRTAYIEIPRKNGKTEIAASIALYLLFADGEAGGEIYSAAGDRDQATLVYNAAQSMVKQSPALLKRCKIIDSQKRIVYYATNSFYRVLSAEHSTKHGVNAHGVIFDELHVQPNRELWDTLTTSGGTRTQPLIVAITTAGYDKNSICWEQHDYAIKVRDGIIKDPTFYPVIYAADEKDDWEDENVWFKANPALDNFRSLDEMRALYKKAKEVPALQNTFKRLYLNIWTSQETRWLDMDWWNACKGEVDPKELEGKVCYGGLDLSSTDDLSAFLLAFPKGEIVKVLPFFFMPSDNIEKRVHRDRVPYDTWVRQGLIYTTPGNVIDYQFIFDKICELAKIYEIKEIAFDPYNALMLNQKLADEGFKMVEVRQGMKSLSPPTKHLETLILSGKLEHGGNPVLTWMFNNVMIVTDANDNRRIDKEKSREKIDGIQALIMAISRVMVQEDKASIYETEKIKVF